LVILKFLLKGMVSMKKLLGSLLVGGLLLTGINTSANANQIIGAISVETNMGIDSPVHPINNIINQDGLILPRGSNAPVIAAPYTSGSTDFLSYVNSVVHNYYGIDVSTLPLGYSATVGEWFANGASSGTITFTLDGLYNIDQLALWNEDSQGIDTFQVYTSVDKSIWTPVSGSSPLSASEHTPNQDYIADTYALTSSIARYVMIDVLTSITGRATGVTEASLGEVAFGGTPVPEPATLILLGTGLMGLVGFRRRK
jgi:hypothetical protein